MGQVSLDDRMSRTRRLLVLLAGFFGFVTSVAIAATPGAAVTDAISANTTVAADSVGVQAATVPALDRERRTPGPADVTLVLAGHLRALAAHALPDATPPADTAYPRPVAASTPVAAPRLVPRPVLLPAGLRVRGPPSITGSDVSIR